MTNLIALVLYFIVSLLGSPIPTNGHVDLCQGNNIDGISQALQIGDDWLVLSDSLYFIDDSCNGAFQIYKIDNKGIEPYNG